MFVVHVRAFVMTESLLEHGRAALTARLTEYIAKTYTSLGLAVPQRSHRTARQPDDFANPASYLARSCVEAMVEALDNGPNTEQLTRSMDGFIKLLALQGWAPSHALKFVFAVKPLLREVLPFEPHSPTWGLLDARVDEIALVAFDLYMLAREKVCESRTQQLKRLHFAMVERACRELASDPPRSTEEPKPIADSALLLCKTQKSAQSDADSAVTGADANCASLSTGFVNKGER